MPIKINDFEWKQNDSLAFIKFNLKNISPKKVDIIYTANYLKVNFCPYIFEVFLRHKIDPEKSSAIIKDGSLHFFLSKEKCEIWKSLEEQSISKDEAQEMRNIAIKEYELNQNKNDKAKKDNKFSIERLAVSKQISLNDEKHLAEKKFLKQEELNFFKECHSTSETSTKENRIRLSSLCSEDGSTVTSEGDYDGDEESVNYSSTENLSGMGKIRHPIIDIEEKKGKNYPSIRRRGCIKIRHNASHRTSIPLRESLSSSLEEETVVRNVKEMSTYETSKQDKEELRAEAKKCYESGDYNGAIKLYSVLLDRFPAQAPFYSNRAAAYIALNKHKEAVADCTKALELLRPSNKENANSRLLCYVRRGTSQVRLGDLGSALIDYESALRLEPSNLTLAKDVANIKSCLKTGEDSTENETSSEEESESKSDQNNEITSQSENSN